MTDALLSFVQISDIHLRPPADRSGWWLSLEPSRLLAAAVAQVAGLAGLDFVLFSGDLLDRAEPAALDQFRALVAALPCPHYVCVGNHDVAIPARPGRFDKASFAAALALPPRLDYSLPVKPGFRLYVLDSVSDEDHHSPGTLHADQLDWLEAELDGHRDELGIVALHHPPLPGFAPYDFRFRPADGRHFSRILEKSPQIACVLNGHLHVPRRWSFHRRPFFSAPSLGGPPNAMRQFTIRRDGERLRLDYRWLTVLPEGRRPLWYPLTAGGRSDREGSILLPHAAESRRLSTVWQGLL